MRRRGSHITIASYGRMLDMALEAAALLATEGVECDVIDLRLRTLKPLDLETLVESAARTGRFVFVEERTGGIGADVCSRVAEACVGTRIVRVAARDVPIPSSGPLEQHVIQRATDIIQGWLNSL